MRYEFPTPPKPQKERFVIAAIGFDHGHIYGMVNDLVWAGATLKWVYDPDPAKLEPMLKEHPGAGIARCEQEILDDPEVQLVASAVVPGQRGDLGFRVMRAGKDYFADKPPLITLSQLEEARKLVHETGRKYACCYSERLQSEECTLADHLIAQGAIGNLVQMIGLGPHKIGPTRPEWFWNRKTGGGILVDIGSHQAEQFLHYAGTDEAEVSYAHVRNVVQQDHPQFHDFGEMNLRAAGGATGYFRLDWLTPQGLPTYGDGRTLLMGDRGYIELRKTIELVHGGNERVYVVDEHGMQCLSAAGCGLPFFPAFIADCLNRTEHAMTQEHAFRAAELAIRAQMLADAEYDY